MSDRSRRLCGKSVSMRYGSVCSGIEAATVAWHPLGWRPSFFSEIEAFPRAVLSHHYAGVPLHGDFTTIKRGDYEPIDLLVGGTPCQSFSVAGARGVLALEYCLLADRLRPRWVAWENVPGCFSTDEGEAFASILSGLVRWNVTVPDGGWKNSGVCAPADVDGAYGVAWRVLNAEYVRTRAHPWAVPQRRRRVFVVGYLGDWRRAAAVLLERESLSGDPAPRREAGQGVAGTLSARTEGGGGLGTDFELDAGLIANSGDVAHCLTASGQNSLDAEVETLLGFDCRGSQVQVEVDGAAPTLRAMGHSGSHANGGGQVAVAYNTTHITSPSNGANPQPGDPCHTLASGDHPPLAIAIKENAARESVSGWGADGGGFNTTGAAYTLEARTVPQSVSDGLCVRRLTPRECERLQGFPDDYTNIPWRLKDGAPDSHRYKALGNSMAINVMRWLGDRIAMVDALDRD